MQNLVYRRAFCISRKILFWVPKDTEHQSVAKDPPLARFSSWGFPGTPFLHYGCEQDFLCVRNHSPDLILRVPASNQEEERNTTVCLPKTFFLLRVRGAAKFTKDHRTCSCCPPLSWQYPVSHTKLQCSDMGHGAEKPKLCSNCPLICKKCQAGHSGRKSRHRIWVSFPRRQWSGLSQASSSTKRVNQGPPLDSQCPSGGQKFFPCPHTSTEAVY